MNAKELYSQMETKSGELAAMFAEHTDKETNEIKSSLPLDEIRNRKKELESIKKQYDEAAEIETIRREAEATADGMKAHTNGRIVGAKTESKPSSLGEAFIQSDAYKNWNGKGGKQTHGTEIDFDVVNGLKATFTTAASTLTQYDRQPGMVLVEQQRLLVRDLLAMGQTTMNTIRYVKEDTYTNAATTVAEGGTKPEASFDTSEADAPVRKIAVVAKVTDEMFADFPQIRDYVNNRLRFMVLQTEEAQLLTGDGNAPNMTGLLNVSGIQTQAMGADNAVDAIYKAMTKIRTVGFFEPDGVVIHENDWQDIKLSKDGNEQYYGGGPFMGPYGNGSLAGDYLWGLRVVHTTAITEGTALVGAYKLGAQFFLRQGLQVETTNSNEDDFKKNLIAIRAEERGALATYRPKAFCTVTGI
jgi:HK97 family phage major capsid protein